MSNANPNVNSSPFTAKALRVAVRGRCGVLRAVWAMHYALLMAAYRFTEYFETEVLRKRPYLKKEWRGFKP